MERVESLDAMPLLWSIDDALMALDRLPRMARNLALSAAKRAIKNVDLKSNAMTVAGAVRTAAADADRPGRDQGSADAASPLSGHADRRHRHHDGSDRAAQKNRSA